MLSFIKPRACLQHRTCREFVRASVMGGFTRLMNPTTDVLEQRLAAMEGGIVSAFQRTTGNHRLAAEPRYSGGHIIRRGALRGKRYPLQPNFQRLGIDDVRRCHQSANIAKVVRRMSRVHIESVANPKNDVLIIGRLPTGPCPRVAGGLRYGHADPPSPVRLRHRHRGL
jgi:O-acetylhomoserine/O-acetylserine sulfhydrylase-like pyridoxal-dependent enzyme